MSFEPSISIEEYNPDISIALFSQPLDFFKPYSEYLKQIGGKFNPNLRGRPGWIFSKKRDSDLRNVVHQIVNGQVAARPIRQASGTIKPGTIPFSQRGITNILQTSRPGIEPSFPGTLQPFSILPGAVPSGYQQIVLNVPLPETGKTLDLEINGSKISMTVESVQQSGGIVNMAIVRLPDGQRTQIKLENGVWKIPGFEQAHSISVPE